MQKKYTPCKKAGQTYKGFEGTMVADKMVYWQNGMGANGTDKINYKSISPPTDDMIFFINPASTLTLLGFFSVFVTYF